MSDTARRTEVDPIPDAPIDKAPQLSPRDYGRLMFACQVLGVKPAEFVFTATLQALDEFDSQDT